MCVLGIGLGDKCLDLLGHLNGPLNLALFFLGFFFFLVLLLLLFFILFFKAEFLCNSPAYP